MPRTGSWEWSRSARTRQSMLVAAREVFTAYGFADAGIAEVVSRAGCSVGSLYHHFGNKAELFLALWEEHQSAYEEGSASAVSAAKAEGVSEPLDLFAVGTRAYLLGCWERRDLIRLFTDGGGPAGFEQLRRTRGRDWLRRNSLLLRAGDSAVDRLKVAMLTSAIGEAGREVALCETREQAEEVIEAALLLIRRLGQV
ncbi:TetR/AcrR family transcriptional regulator [Nonomuraea sp. NPDC050663]|uniref:TetR/AcrR family transcriptional regulator n=1 Tax=Nonomuraea sp. NPDC050663 TaxID=3364370 RepID=UPI0037BA027F